MSRRALSSTTAVVVALVLAVAALQTPPAQARERTPYRITLQATATTVHLSDPNPQFYGKVRPNTRAARRDRVELQLLDQNGEAETTEVHKLKRNGRYRFRDIFFVEPGTYVLRARISASENHRAGISDELTVVVLD